MYQEIVKCKMLEVEYIINFALAVSYMVALLASRKSGLG